MASYHVVTSESAAFVRERKPVSLGTRHSRNRPHTSAGRRPQPSLRTRVLAGFRELAIGCDGEVALARTKAFYRSAGADWTNHLS